MIRLYARFLKPYLPRVCVVVITTILTTFISLLLPMMSKVIIDKGIIGKDLDLVAKCMIFMLVLAVVSVLIAVIGSHVSSSISMGFSRDVRRTFFAHVTKLSQGDIEDFGSSSLISRQTNDIMQLQTVLVQLLQMFLVAPVMCLGGIVMAFLTAPKMFWMLCVVLPVAIVIMSIFMSRGAKIFSKTQVLLDRVNQIIRENLNGMRVIRAFNREEFEVRHFAGANKDLRKFAEKGTRIMNSTMPIMTVLVNATNLLILYFGSRYMDNRLVSYGDVQAFVQYVMMILTGFVFCSLMIIFLPKGQVSAKRVNEVLDKNPSVTDPENPVKFSEIAVPSIEFSHVSFAYPGAEKPVLDDINFSAKAGQTVAVIGGTGSGKSTLLNLISRFYDVTSGSITVNGTDIRNVTVSDLTSRLSIVPQKAFLFSGTIFDNIRYGKPDATMEEVMHALDVSQSRDFVEQKEGKVQSRIAQSGSNVSGGQKQRLAIARALVKKADIYLFDDSFSALDFKTDALLRAALKPEMSNAVMIVVAQRVSTIKDADRILVLDAGRVVGDGTHDELMKTCGVYREIALSQTAAEEKKAV